MIIFTITFTLKQKISFYINSSDISEGTKSKGSCTVLTMVSKEIDRHLHNKQTDMNHNADH